MSSHTSEVVEIKVEGLQFVYLRSITQLSGQLLDQAQRVQISLLQGRFFRGSFQQDLTLQTTIFNTSKAVYRPRQLAEKEKGVGLPCLGFGNLLSRFIWLSGQDPTPDCISQSFVTKLGSPGSTTICVMLRRRGGLTVTSGGQPGG